ncbi:MAG: hypothetical protein HXS41_11970 [Theionarchaea archaeon]|nr:hypothetical protein [Theionarchaea archaeon]MBU7001406.1 hypothetical protein [Theionarchaea archaeon]MBU7021767.1 hypothetical protein [Theionarchaea archaeon]MBU7034491.1 hypothetical protein [Theionarchaea archaeon]MBU7040812.1 hypothetical protein [Theionarchaea archaeon]
MSERNQVDNTLMRVYLDTIQNILGSQGLNSVLNYGGLEKYINNLPPDNDELEIPREDLRKLHQSLIDLFGEKGARGILLRIGRGMTFTFLEKRPAVVKSMKLAIKLLPEVRQMRLSLERFAEESDRRIPSLKGIPHIELREEKDYFLFIDEDSYTSEGIVSENPSCHVYVGNLETSLEWITGHAHKVEEIQCKARGDPADVFRIWKKRSTD